MKKYLLVLLMLLVSIPALSVPQQIYFQGILLDSNGNAITGSRDMTFKVYDVATGGTALDTDEHTNVSVSNGLYTVKLSVDSSHFNGNDRYIGITIDNDSEMTPRVQVLSVPYVYNSATADSAINSDTVNTINASSSATANYLYPLNSSSKFPVAVITQGPGSGLDSDTLDGYEATDFSLASGNYLVKTGDEMTGTLTMGAGDIDLPTSTATMGAVRVNGSPFIHSYGTSNIFMGKNAGNFTMNEEGWSGYAEYNVGIGENALSSIDYGVDNIAIGYEALKVNDGDDNIAVGYRALYSNDGGFSNTAIGTEALYENILGDDNLAIGIDALYSTTGSYNVGIGSHAGRKTTGHRNVFIGYQAGREETGSDKLYISNSDTATPLIWGDFSTNDLTLEADVRITGDLTVESDVYATYYYGDGSNLTGVMTSGASGEYVLKTGGTMSGILTMGAHVLPLAGTYDLGSWDFMWNDIYVDNNVYGSFIGDGSGLYLPGYVKIDPGTAQSTASADSVIWIKNTAERGSGISVEVTGSSNNNNGINISAYDYGIYSVAQNQGVYGKGYTYGVRGEYRDPAVSSLGMLGQNTIGVYGTSNSTAGLSYGGKFDNPAEGMFGLYAAATATSGDPNYGGWIATSYSGGYALVATNEGSVKSAKLGTPTHAGEFLGGVYVDGGLQITGTLTKGAGTFLIDHPLDPANKYLAHSFVESPDMKNIYDGTVVLDKNGETVIELPDYFEALNEDFRYQLTTIGDYAPVYIKRKIKDNKFTIAGGKPGMEVSWMVTGIRHDAYAADNRIVVETDKAVKGEYLYPAGFNKKHANN